MEKVIQTRLFHSSTHAVQVCASSGDSQSRIRSVKTKMISITLSSPPSVRLHRVNAKPIAPLRNLSRPMSFSCVSHASSSLCFNPLRLLVDRKEIAAVRLQKKRGSGVVCYAAPLTVRNLQWISTISSATLLLAKGTPVQKSFLVPLFALQAPPVIVSWIKGEYGIWAAFLAMLVRLFFFIPGELEIPYAALLFLIVAPNQVMRLRGTQEGCIIALVIAGYLGFQHFSSGSMQKAFEQGSIVSSLAILCIAALVLIFFVAGR